MLGKIATVAFLITATSVLPGCASTSGSSSTQITMEEFRVPSDAGIEVYVRNKRPAGMTQFSQIGRAHV